MQGMQRQLPYLRKIAKHHLLMVVFFENTELRQLIESETADVESVYVKTIGEKFAFEKKLIVKELQQYGILAILTSPKYVTVNTVNKYLELKAKHAIWQGLIFPIFNERGIKEYLRYRSGPVN